MTKLHRPFLPFVLLLLVDQCTSTLQERDTHQCAIWCGGDNDNVCGLHAGDILVVDGQADVLYKVDPSTGFRTKLSNFSDPAQGVTGINEGTVGVAVGRDGEIFISQEGAQIGVIFSVSACNGFRTLISNFTFAAGVTPYFGLALDGADVVVNAFFEFFTFQCFSASILRLTPAQLLPTSPTQRRGPSFDPFLFDIRGVDLVVDKCDSLIVGIDGFFFDGTPETFLFQVCPETGDRRILSNLSDAAQGPVGSFSKGFTHGLDIEADGTIVVCSTTLANNAEMNELLKINPRTGIRTLLRFVLLWMILPKPKSHAAISMMPPKALQLIILRAAAERAGTVLTTGTNLPNINLRPSLFRVDQTGQRVVLSDPSNQDQGPKWLLFWPNAFVKVVPEPGTRTFGHNQDVAQCPQECP